MDDEPVRRLEELHERALCLPVAQLLHRVDGLHGQRVDARVVHARGDVHRRRDEVLHLARAIAVRLEEHGQLDHVGHRGARVTGDEVGHQVLLLAGPGAGPAELLGKGLELAVARLLHEAQHAVGLVLGRHLEMAAHVMRHQLLHVGVVQVGVETHLGVVLRLRVFGEGAQGVRAAEFHVDLI